jgi:hypothetical protein
MKRNTRKTDIHSLRKVNPQAVRNNEIASLLHPKEASPMLHKKRIPLAPYQQVPIVHDHNPPYNAIVADALLPHHQSDKDEHVSMRITLHPQVLHSRLLVQPMSSTFLTNLD